MAKIECLAEHIHPLSLFILLALFICRPKSEVVNIECLAEHIHPLNLFILLAIFIRGPKSQMSRWAYSSSKTIHPAGPIHPSTKEWCQTRLGWGWYYSILNCQAGWVFLRILGRKRIVTYNSQILFQGVWDKFVLTKTSPNAHCTLHIAVSPFASLHIASAWEWAELDSKQIFLLCCSSYLSEIFVLETNKWKYTQMNIHPYWTFYFQCGRIHGKFWQNSVRGPFPHWNSKKSPAI